MVGYSKYCLFEVRSHVQKYEFLYLTDLLGSLVPLVLDVYAVHHREDNVKKNVEALIKSLLKKKNKVKKESSNKNRKDVGEDNWNNLRAVADDIAAIENRLEFTKELFLAL
ncbi:hypothetical protein C2G38_2027587 [Gigaspora rosea]|uniref:Uncharacterized protein n=1 Tax=Gigaspora rosea TaxID=44941 RepID=A0A397WC54_9GLOM|nr:hypothetical protein C2G38_2027587 [Gigaspora rosea]